MLPPARIPALMFLALGAVLVLVAGSVASASLLGDARLAGSFLLGNIQTGAACQHDSDCKGAVLPGGGAAGSALCKGGQCWSTGFCDTPGQNNPQECAAVLGLSCVKQWTEFPFNNTGSCCIPSGTQCKGPDQQSSRSCCNDNEDESRFGNPQYANGVPFACISSAAGNDYTCQQCNADGDLIKDPAAGVGIFAEPLSTCCTGFASNFILGNPNHDVACCSNLGQACGHGRSYCCGSTMDILEPQPPAPTAECSPYTALCCTLDTFACQADTDCCSGNCDASGHCDVPACFD